MIPFRLADLFRSAFLIFFLFSAFSSHSKEKPDIRFDHYTIREGLSQSTVNCILQDEKGLIWIGTQDGLNRFNGYGFDVFQKDPQDSNSISNNFVHSLCKGPDGGVVVGTEYGIDHYDPEKDAFSNIPFPGGMDPIVHSLEKDDRGRIWIGTAEEGLWYFSKDSAEAIKAASSLSSSSVQVLLSVSEDSLWVGTEGKGLFRFDPSEGEVHGTPLRRMTVHSIGSHEDPGLWVGTDQGAYQLGTRGERIELLKSIEAGEGKGKLPHPVVRAVHRDRKDRLWFGTAGGGISRLYRNEGGSIRFHHYQHQDYIPSSLANDLVYAIHEDRTGSIWIGSRRGVSKFDPKEQ